MKVPSLDTPPVDDTEDGPPDSGGPDKHLYFNAVDGRVEGHHQAPDAAYWYRLVGNSEEATLSFQQGEYPLVVADKDLQLPKGERNQLLDQLRRTQYEDPGWLFEQNPDYEPGSPTRPADAPPTSNAPGNRPQTWPLEYNPARPNQMRRFDQDAGLAAPKNLAGLAPQGVLGGQPGDVPSPQGPDSIDQFRGTRPGPTPPSEPVPPMNQMPPHRPMTPDELQQLPQGPTGALAALAPSMTANSAVQTAQAAAPAAVTRPGATRMPVPPGLARRIAAILQQRGGPA